MASSDADGTAAGPGAGGKRPRRGRAAAATGGRSNAGPAERAEQGEGKRKAATQNVAATKAAAPARGMGAEKAGAAAKGPSTAGKAATNAGPATMIGAAEKGGAGTMGELLSSSSLSSGLPSALPQADAGPPTGQHPQVPVSDPRPAAGQADETPSPPSPSSPPTTASDPPADARAEAAEHVSADEKDTSPSDEDEMPPAQRLARNIERIEGLSARLMAALAQHRPTSAGVQGPGPALYMAAMQGLMKTAAIQPEKIMQAQTSYWAETLRLYAAAQAELVQGRLDAPADSGPGDARFRNPLWRSHPFFNLVRKQYQINAASLAKAAADLDIEDPTDRRRVTWFTRQLIDMMSPSNFLATNPDALQRAVETEGESLVRGLENLVADAEAHGGEAVVSLVDREAFRVGENIATSPGGVVARTPLYELIQYAPSTETVRQIPLIVFPPWINKFYILDLKPQNSLIRWLVGQGFTLFVVSWKNPDGQNHAEVELEDYIRAYLDAMDEVRARTGAEQLNAVGYCIGGTTLALTLALLQARGDDRVAAASLFTTLTDFSETGEFTTFLQDDFLGGIDDEIARTGVLGASLMARTFSFLRANDLIWGPAIRSYMLGDAPPAFDLLYWNGDGTNLPGRMARQYLRDLCQANRFAGEGYNIMGTTLRLADLRLPLCAIACEGDHIAPWLDCWRGFAMTGSSERRFLLSQSGHIAGIINPPGRVKYGHYTSDGGFDGTAQDWRACAQFHEGSWWPSWLDWLVPHAGGMVPARAVEQPLAPAPGTYVHEAAP